MFPIPLQSLSDQERHDYILKTYVLNKEQSAASRKYKRDIDVIKENHRFLWESSDETDSWEKQLARRYYDKLFKEYCISDLSRYNENKVALRWRIEAEVISGKGQFQCGNRKCEEREGLKSWEVNFAYIEQGERKNALVKLRLCPEHSSQLNYTSRKREIKRLKHTEKLRKKESKRQSRKSKTIERGVESSIGEANCIDNSIDAGNTHTIEPATSSEANSEKHTHSEHVEDGTMENIWSKKLEINPEEHTREMDFEQYLEDLLL